MNYAYKDDQYAIILLKDGYQGIVVQLVSFVPKMMTNGENQLEEHLMNEVLHTQVIKVRDENSILNKNFKSEVGQAISSCQQLLGIIKQNLEYIEGALRDYGKK